MSIRQGRDNQISWQQFSHRLATADDRPFLDEYLRNQIEEYEESFDFPAPDPRHICTSSTTTSTIKKRIQPKQKQQKHFNEIAEMLADGKITPEQACSLIEDLRDAGNAEEMDAQNEQQKGFNEIAGLFSDWKITTEEACDVFKEWLDEWKPKAAKAAKAELTVLKKAKTRAERRAVETPTETPTEPSLSKHKERRSPYWIQRDDKRRNAARTLKVKFLEE